MSKFILCGLVILFIVVMVVHYKNMEGFANVGPISVGSNTIYAFDTDGTWTAPAGVRSIELLVVAGGGGGGSSTNRASGGGGGGGVIYNQTFTVTPNTSYPITVGAGGAGGTGVNKSGNNGGNSSFGWTTAVGGGGGGDSNVGLNGGSGGGGSQKQDGGTGISGQGNRGGSGNHSYINGYFYYGGGGGGAGGASTSNQGGIGLSNSIIGIPVAYSAGGSGGGQNAGSSSTLLAPSPGGGAGGLGGGIGDNPTGVVAVGGNATTPGSGGGGGSTTGGGGNGANGIVIIKYTTPPPPLPTPTPTPPPVPTPSPPPPPPPPPPVDNTAINKANAEIAELRRQVAANTQDIESRKTELELANKLLKERVSVLETARTSGDTAAAKQAAADVTQARNDKDAAAAELAKAIAAQQAANKNLADATAYIQKMSKDAADALASADASKMAADASKTAADASKMAAEKDAKAAADSAAKAAADAKSISDSKAAMAPPIIIVSQKVNNQVLDIITNTTDGSTINNANIVYSSSIPILSRGQSSDSMLQSIPVISPIPSVTKIPLQSLKDGYKYYIINSNEYTEGSIKLLGSFQYFTSNTVDFNMPEITSQCSKPSQDTSCDSVIPTRTDFMPDTSVSNCTNTATQLQGRSNMLENIQNNIKNNMLSSRCTTPIIPGQCDTQTTCMSQGQEYEDSCYKGRCPKNPDGTCPPTPDMSDYIKKDAIPCWGCNIDY